MERKSKKELLQIIEEQEQNLLKYKSRLHDIVGSYKHLLKEKETLESSIKTLTEAGNIPTSEDEIPSDESELNGDGKNSSEKRNDLCLQQLRSSLGALTIEKSRIENELRTDRKKILQQKEELERNIAEKESKWLVEKDHFENQIIELRKKVGIQQREREKEQQDHVLMLKELQNVLANERAMKEKFEEQMGELQQRFSTKISDRKVLDYEKSIEELQNKLTVSQDHLRTSENEVKRISIMLQKFRESREVMDEMKKQYSIKIYEEKNRADLTEEKLKLLTFVKEKRIASLENKISELSTVVGDHDKLRQQDQIAIQKLKARVTQLQAEYSAFAHIPPEEPKYWEFSEPVLLGNQDNIQTLRSAPEVTYRRSVDLSNPEISKDIAAEKEHIHCQTEIARLKDELEQCKIKAESAWKEKYSKTSAALLSDARSGKEIKQLKSRIKQLQDQLQTCKGQLKINEEYHTKITANLDKSSEDLRMQHKQEISQLELSHRTQLLELEHQIQKQRERTLSLLEEKDKEIVLLKTSFLSPFVRKDNITDNDSVFEDSTEPQASDQEAAANMLSNSLISSKKDGHILHYIQELSRKDVEISNLRQSRIQTESTLRKLQQALAIIEDQYHEEVETLKSRIKLLESSQDEEGTNVEYLKNVVLRFLQCTDPSSRRHMVNAISTVLHFTTSEIQEIKEYIK